MADFRFQDIAIEEQQGIERLRLGGGGDTSYCREMIDEGNDAGRANGTWVLAAMEMDVPTNPEPISLLGAAAQVSSSANHGHLVHEPERGWGGGARLTP